MARELKEWAKDAQKIRELGVENTTGKFLRDPLRACRLSSKKILSPADGIILYQKEVNPRDKILEVKGQVYDLRTVMADPEFKERCLVIGIFMTFYDVHVNRCPYNGYLYYEEESPLMSNNLPMVFFEDKLIKGLLNFGDAEFLFANSRMINKFVVPSLDWHYYLVQIADREVNVVMHFERDQGEFIGQGDRFSVVRWGSQVDLVLPLRQGLKFVPLIKDMFHVEAGIDQLLRIETT